TAITVHITHHAMQFTTFRLVLTPPSRFRSVRIAKEAVRKCSPSDIPSMESRDDPAFRIAPRAVRRRREGRDPIHRAGRGRAEPARPGDAHPDAVRRGRAAWTQPHDRPSLPPLVAEVRIPRARIRPRSAAGSADRTELAAAADPRFRP